MVKVLYFVADPERHPAQVPRQALAGLRRGLVPGRHGDPAPRDSLDARLDRGERLQRVQGQHTGPRGHRRVEHRQVERARDVRRKLVRDEPAVAPEGPAHLFHGVVRHAYEHQTCQTGPFGRAAQLREEGVGQVRGHALRGRRAPDRRDDPMAGSLEEHAERRPHTARADDRHVHDGQG